MPFRAALFDLDGTLLDTLEDLADSMNAALERLGHPTHPLAAFKQFVGDGIQIFAARAHPELRPDDAAVAELVSVALQEYANRWQDKTRPYEGVVPMLETVFARGLKVGILSNKPHDFTCLTTKTLLPDFDFDLVWGVSDEVPKKPEPTGALRAAAQLGAEPHDVLYCGDTDTDMKTAVAAGMYPAGALWGFRGADELLTSGARVLLDSPRDLLELL